MIVGLLALPLAAAVPCDGTGAYTIDSIEVNDIEIFEGGNAVFVESDSRMSVEVYLTGAEHAYDSRIEAWIGGYEYGVLRDTTPIFEVEEGVEYKKTLYIDVPNDVEASDDYTLNIEIFDDDASCKQSYTLRVQEIRHELRIFDTIFSPSQSVEAGQPLFASVRVENLGDNVEEDVKVTVAIPELNVADSEYIDELITDVDEDDGGFEFDEEDAESTDDLLLFIPADAAAGVYTVDVTVEYDRGHKVVSETYEITVSGSSATPVADAAEALVNVDAASQNVQAGQGVVYTLSVANLGAQASAYTFDVMGADGFATYRVDPQLLTVAAGQTGTAYLYVTPRSEVAGTQTFSVKVSADGSEVADLALVANVSAAESANNVSTFKTILEVGFVVLLIILVVLGIVIIAKKIREGDDDGTEDLIEGQTYY